MTQFEATIISYRTARNLPSFLKTILFFLMLIITIFEISV
jgi:hypothetical protein